MILVYDTTSAQSFASVEAWMGEVRQHAPPDVVPMLVATKCDLADRRAVTREQGQQVHVRCVQST